MNHENKHEAAEARLKGCEQEWVDIGPIEAREEEITPQPPALRA